MPIRYFEDYHPGEVERFGAERVTREEVIAFARRFDPQPFHLSDEAARTSPFGRVAASGWHTGSMAMTMIVAQKQEQGAATLAGLGLDELRWISPVYPGDVLSCEARIASAQRSRSNPARGIVRTEVSVLNQDSTVVMRFIATELIAARPSEASSDPS